MRRLVALMAGAAFAVGSLAAEQEFFLRGGDRVVFLGDSITEQKLHTTYIEAYAVTRFPKDKFNFWNSGWGGDTAWLRNELKVSGLPEERCDILIDGEFATTATREELAKGWNLAVSAGPITRQGQEVLALIVKKNLAVQTLWEANIRPWMKKERPAPQQRVDEEEAHIAAACQTKPHHFELKPAV